MAIYRFRVILEDHDDFFRDVEIKSHQTFEDLHNIVQQTMNFDNKHLASFYICDASWNKGKEITLLDMGEGDSENPPLTMKDAVLSHFMDDPHQKLIYVFDFMQMWTFYLELIKISQEDKADKTVFPRVFRAQGDPPLQYGPSIKPITVGEEFFEETLLVDEILSPDGDDEFGQAEEEEESENLPEEFNDFV
ncbi:MAG: plasmid pRiA4b ORF-3 family protein [Bacteroidetes bacterium]|nr:plasmid pRiA4b ORF-3 family protein [Bacteroidota bacterium]MBU1720027.1 plasmid pRiA4b ORF-3 family protein [Bacteroidota bacterium]